MHIGRLRRRGAEASILHGTAPGYELDRIARENGEPDWASLVLALPRRVMEDDEYRSAWNLPIEDRPADLHDLAFVPRFDPLKAGRLPGNASERIAHVERIARVLLDQALDTDEPGFEGAEAHRLLTTATLEAIDDAAGTSPTMTGVRRMLEDVVSEAHADRRASPDRNADHWADVLLRRAAKPGLPSSRTTTWSRLAAMGVGFRSGVFGAAEGALLIFRNPHVSDVIGRSPEGDAR